ncbi:MAG: NUDIX hydrolase [Aggregatilineales bacterium]
MIFRLFQRKYTIGVVGVVFNKFGEVLIVEHVFHPKHPWGLPGGWLEHSETPSETIIRELREELTLTVETGPVLLMEFTNRNHLDIAFLCNAKSEIGNISKELLGYQWIKPETLPRIRFFHKRAIQQALSFNELNGIDL